MKRQTTENLLLASIIRNPHLFVNVADITSPDMFTGYRRAWAEATWAKFVANEKPEYHTLRADTKEEHRTELENVFFELGNSDGLRLANELKETYLQEQASEALRLAQNSLTSGSGFTEVASRLIENLNELAQVGAATEKDLSRYEHAKRLLWHDDTLIPSGFEAIDKRIGGWPIGMNILAARPGMGKTTLAVWFLVYAAQAGKKVLIYSLEMSTEEILRKMACNICLLNPNDFLKFTEADKKRVESAIEQLKKMDIWIRDSQDFSGKIEDVESEVFAYKQKYDIDFVAYDYLSLFTSYHVKDKYERAGIVSKTVTQVANRYKIPAIVLSQLNREVEKNPGCKPKMSNISLSDEIVQDAKSITTVYRPEYYGILEDGHGNSLRGITEIQFAKFRPNGAVQGTGAILKYHPGTGEFIDAEDAADFEQLSSLNLVKLDSSPDYDEDFPF